MNKIRFEKLSDVNFTYPFLEVFLGSSDLRFLEIGITDAKKLNFTFYPNKVNIVLSWEDWSLIHDKAVRFLEQELRDEKDFQDLMGGG